MDSLGCLGAVKIWHAVVYDDYFVHSSLLFPNVFDTLLHLYQSSDPIVGLINVLTKRLEHSFDNDEVIYLVIYN